MHYVVIKANDMAHPAKPVAMNVCFHTDCHQKSDHYCISVNFQHLLVNEFILVKDMLENYMNIFFQKSTTY